MIRTTWIGMGLCLVTGAGVAAEAPNGQSTANADAAANSTLTEIVVNAQRRSENLEQVPIAVTAITGERLASAVIRDTQDLAAVTPGLTFPSDFQYALPHIRGVGNTTVAAGAENSVALYVDGVYYASATGSILTLNNVAQIEVLKGPQGTLFGRNATGGLIQVITKSPTQDPHLEANLTYGNYDTASVDLYATDGLARDLAADVAIKVTRQGTGWGNNYYSDREIYKMDRDISARSKVVWSPDTGPRITLSMDYENSKNSIGLAEAPGTYAANPFYPAAVIATPPYSVNSNTEPLMTHRGGGASLHFEQDLGFADLVNIVAYRRSVDYFTVDFDLGPAQLISDITNQADNQVSEEFQLRSHSSGPLQWTAGVYYFRAKASFDPLTIGLGGPVSPSVGPGAFLTSTIINATQVADSIAGYLQGTYAITEHDNLTVGARYTHEKRSFDASENGVINDAVVVPLFSGLTPSFSVNKPTWRAALDHRFTDDVMAYVSYNRGFKSGGYNPGDPTSPAYQTEQLDAYEVGLKTQLLDHRLRVNSAAFYYDYKNIQVSRFVNGTPDVYNGAAARIFGLDVDMDAALGEHFELNAGVEALHDWFSSFPCADYFVGGPQASSEGCPNAGLGPVLPYNRSALGRRLPDTPNFNSSVTLDYHTALLGGQIQLAVTDAYNSGFFYEQNNGEAVRQGAYNLVNGSATWTTADERYLLRLWTKNLADKRYTSELASSSTGYAAAYAPPRTYGLTVGVKF